jgi:hypothetical protein
MDKTQLRNDFEFLHVVEDDYDQESLGQHRWN